MELTPAQFSEIRGSLAALEKEDRSAEKRRFTRLHVQGNITLTDRSSGQSHTAMTRDLSLQGMSVIQSVKAPAGQRFVAHLPRSESNCVKVVCVVVETRALAEGLYCVHMQFESVVKPDKRPDPGKDRLV